MSIPILSKQPKPKPNDAVKLLAMEVQALHYRFNVFAQCLLDSGVMTPEQIKAAQGAVDARDKILGQ